MADEEVKIYGSWRSPFSKRVELALKMKEVKYEFVQENLSDKSPLLLKYNPVHKKVPVLLHNGHPIPESLVILEYIDETWKSGAPLLPTLPYERTNARFWAKFIDDKFFETLKRYMGSRGEERMKMAEEMEEHLKALDNELKNKNFFGGESIGMVDIVGVLIAFWFDVIEEAFGTKLLAREKYINLSGWMDRYLNCNIVKENLPPRAELLAFIKARYST